jgi:hypothetical protein
MKNLVGFESSSRPLSAGIAARAANLIAEEKSGARQAHK